MRTGLALTVALAVACVAGDAQALLGTDTAGEYAYSDSDHATDPDSPLHTYTSIAATGTLGPSGDDSVAGVKPLDIDKTGAYQQRLVGERPLINATTPF